MGSLKKITKLILLFTLLHLTVLSQRSSIETLCLSEEEMKLTELINSFRKQNKLPEISVSISLSYVAKTHVYDLQNHKPDTSICSTLSWSNKGKWTDCCFNNYVLKYECMWEKPKELTSYQYRGYELSYYEEGIIYVDSVFNLWKKTPAVVDMLLGRNIHSDKKWLAFGVGISDNYVSVWFGQRADPAGKASKCNKFKEEVFSPLVATSDSVVAKPKKESKFYIIYGSFNNVNDANEAIKRFRNSGLKNVQIVPRDGRFRIALDVFKNLNDAKAALEKLAHSYPEAWIFKD